MAEALGVSNALAMITRVLAGVGTADDLADADWTLDARIEAARAISSAISPRAPRILVVVSQAASSGKNNRQEKKKTRPFGRAFLGTYFLTLEP